MADLGSRRPARGFVLIEAAAVVLVIVVLLAVLSLCAGGSRRLGRLGEDIARLKQVGAATGQYGADNGDLFWTFSWRHGQVYQTQYPDLNNAFDDLQAASNQAVYLMRTLGNRPNMPVLGSFIPHISYSHLVLAAYTNQRLPWLGMVSSGDVYRRKWEMDPACLFQNCFAPYQPNGSDPSNWRWVFSSSFAPVVALFDGSPVGARLDQSGNSVNQYFYFGQNTILGGQSLASVA